MLCYNRQMAQIASVSDSAPAGAVRRAVDYGVDVTLLIENLRRTPTERLRQAEAAMRGLARIREDAERNRRGFRTRR